MLKRTTNFITSIMVMALFMVASVLAPMEAQAKKVKDSGIPVIGKTADGKYPIYDLQGDLEDVHWMSKDTNYDSGYLLENLIMVDVKDVNNGVYTCGFVCKNAQQKIVGVSGKYAFLLKKKK